MFRIVLRGLSIGFEGKFLGIGLGSGYWGYRVWDLNFWGGKEVHAASKGVALVN
jgi:hypothetical protein